MAINANGVSFDGLHSYNDFGMWFALRPDYGKPDPKTNISEVPGMDGVLDMTEANSGDVKFTNRTMVFTFSKLIRQEEQEDFKANVRAALHGKYIQKIIPDDAPDWYYTGRAKVEFQKLASWKLRCVVTVDAAPYALRVDETVVDLMAAPGGAELSEVFLPTTDASKMTWNSDLRLGTKAFPGRLLPPANAMNDLILKIPENPTHFETWSFQVTDAVGNTYNSGSASWSQTVQNPDYPNMRISLSNISQAGVDLTKVYRILVSGIGGCSLHWEMLSIHTTVVNSRKTVIPIVELETQEDSVEIIVNGEKHEILPGKAVYENLMLSAGTNEIYVPVVQASVFTLTFREGRL